MKGQSKVARRVLATMAASMLITAHSSADEPQDDEQLAQLRRNLHDMRLVIDSERSQRKAARRGNAMPLVVDSLDAPGIGTMRVQLAQSLERLGNRCFGNEIDADGGNVILICGDNAGSAESANVTSAAYTTVQVEPPDSTGGEEGDAAEGTKAQAEGQP